MDIGAIFTTPGIGGLIAVVVLGCATVLYIGLTVWILRGVREAEPPWERMGWPFD